MAWRLLSGRTPCARPLGALPNHTTPVITPRPASKTSEMLNISEHPQSRRRLGWHRWRRIFLPSEKINRSRIMSFNTGGSWTQACTNELPQHSSNELPSTGQKCSIPSTFLAFSCMIRRASCIARRFSFVGRFPHSSSCAHVGGAFAFTLGTTSVAVVGAGIGALIGSGIGAGGIGSGAGIGSGTADVEVAADVEVEVAAGSTLMRRSINTA